MIQSKTTKTDREESGDNAQSGRAIDVHSTEQYQVNIDHESERSTVILDIESNGENIGKSLGSKSSIQKALSTISETLSHQNLLTVSREKRNRPTKSLVVIDYLSKVVVCYTAVLLLCGVFVFSSNILIEVLLLISSGDEVLESVFVYAPQFVVILVICYKITNQCWKTVLVIWFNRFDAQCLRLRLCGFGVLAPSKALCVRSFIMMMIIGIAFKKTLSEALDRERVHSIDDLVIFKNLNVVSIWTGAVLCGTYFVAAMLWRMWVLFGCVVDTESAVRLLALDYVVDQEHWRKAVRSPNSPKCGFTKKLYDEMLRLTENQSDCRNESRNSKKAKCGVTVHWMRWSVRWSLLIWYLAQCVVMALFNKHHPFAFSLCCIVLPLMLYLLLLLDQSKIKLFQYASGYRSSRGPMIIKILLTIWFIMAAVFVSTYVFIAKYQNELMSNRQVLDQHDDDHQSSAYPLCREPNELHDLFATAFLSKLAYDPAMSDKDTLQRVVTYFFQNRRTEAPEEQWQVVRECKVGKEGEVGVHSVFFHLQKKEFENSVEKVNNIIVVRGTSTLRDFHEDFSMYSEVLAIHWFSKLLPINNLLPRSVLQSFIGKMVFSEGIIYREAQNRHYKAILKYIENQFKSLSDSEKKNVDITMMGHSLGGIVSHIVATKLKMANQYGLVRSIGISNAGLVLSAQKFGIDPEVLRRVATTIAPDLDPIPLLDVQSGTVHHIACKSGYSRQQCHSVGQTLFELYDTCSMGNEVSSEFRDVIRTARKQKMLPIGMMLGDEETHTDL